MKIIHLTQGKQTIVDDEDYDRLSAFSWCLTPGKHTHYASRGTRIGGIYKRVLMHREILLVPEGKFVDHIDRDGLNNTKENLRICTPSENARNSKIPITNTSGYIGVSFDRRDRLWYSYINVNDKKIHIGTFKNPIDAALTRDKKAREIHGDFAHLNFPPQDYSGIEWT